MAIVPDARALPIATHEVLPAPLLLDTDILTEQSGEVRVGPYATAIWERLRDGLQAVAPELPGELPPLTADAFAPSAPAKTVRARHPQPERLAARQIEAYRRLARGWLSLPARTARRPAASMRHVLDAPLPDGRRWQVAWAEADPAGRSAAWGISPALLLRTIATHTDQRGLVLPPRIAPTQIVILPRNDLCATQDQPRLAEYSRRLLERLRRIDARAHIDASRVDHEQKRRRWVRCGTPLRLEISLADVAAQRVEIFPRDSTRAQRWPWMGLAARLDDALDALQMRLLERAHDAAPAA